MQEAHRLSNLQQELLKLYSWNIAETDLRHIRHYLAKYFAQNAIDEADNIWDRKGCTNDTTDKWLSEL